MGDSRHADDFAHLENFNSILLLVEIETYQLDQLISRISALSWYKCIGHIIAPPLNQFELRDYLTQIFR